MLDRNPIEFSAKVLDQRNNLSGPDDSGKASFPERPQQVSIQQPNNKSK